jgi:hypothetical protein
MQVNRLRQWGSRERLRPIRIEFRTSRELLSGAANLRAGSYDWRRFRQQPLRIGDVDQSATKASDAIIRQASDNS